jgi:hypothetical protein
MDNAVKRRLEYAIVIVQDSIKILNHVASELDGLDDDCSALTGVSAIARTISANAFILARLSHSAEDKLSNVDIY